MEEVIAKFYATIPQIQSAISIGGDRSARLKLDVPATEIAEIVKFAGFGPERLLKIVVLEAE